MKTRFRHEDCNERIAELERALVIAQAEHACEWRVKCGHLEMERDEARAEVERLRKDGERLDWIDKRGDIGRVEIDPDLVGETTSFAWNHFVRKSLRAAIDAAMEDEQ